MEDAALKQHHIPMAERTDMEHAPAVVPEGSAPAGVAIVDLNPFSDAVVTNPQDFNSVWLDAGPVFWLASIGTYGIARHAEVMSVLKDWKHFCNGGGIGLQNKLVDPGHLPKSRLLEADPPEHTHSRSIMNKLFSAKALEPLFDSWRLEANALVAKLVQQRQFDAVTDLASVYGHSIVPREIGLMEVRPDLITTFGSAGTNSVYPHNARYRDSQADPLLPEAIAWVSDSCARERLSPDGWGAAVHTAADRGDCTRAKALMLVWSLIVAGTENTVIAMGNLIHAFATHPDQWSMLKADRALVRNAVEELLRWDGPNLQFFRTTAQETPFGGITIPAGSKVLMQWMAANHDPRRWTNPDRFDISRDATGHVGFGFGIHQCLGQIVARKQISLILEALLDQVQSIRLAAEPVRRVNNQAHAFAHLPVAVVPA
jgi:4-methoxybenzoate monooxygenase (O-demethylating)